MKTQINKLKNVFFFASLGLYFNMTNLMANRTEVDLDFNQFNEKATQAGDVIYNILVILMGLGIMAGLIGTVFHVVSDKQGSREKAFAFLGGAVLAAFGLFIVNKFMG